MRVKTSAQAAAAMKTAIPGVSAKYKAGIERTEGWKEKAIDGQALYEQRMQDPAVLNRRKKALEDTSEATWKQRASDLGTQRIASGMEKNIDKYQKNVDPYLKELESIDLPAKTADPRENVMNRVVPIAEKLAAKKAELSR